MDDSNDVPVQVRDPTGYIVHRAPLDRSNLNLNADNLEFWKAHTGINDEEALREHIISFQADAYDVCVSVQDGFGDTNQDV